MAVPWQMRIGPSLWTDFDAATSGLFEAGFISGATHIVQITGRISGPSVTQDFDVHKMEWGGIPVRRSLNNPVPTMVEFWDDDAWEPFDSYAQCLLGTAMAVGREKVTIHVGSASYDITLTPGNCMQTNLQSGRSRPLRINGSIASVLGDITDDEEEEEDITDDSSMPNEYRCPITQMPMKKPVMMCDGHSYEYRAIQKWLLKKQTSPVTGKALANTTMTVNHALKKLIRDWDNGSTAPAAASRAGSSGAGGSDDARKSSLACDEDLFGSDDDDDDDDGFKPMPDAIPTRPGDAAVVQEGIVLSRAMDFGEREQGQSKKKMRVMRK
jgi:hypothetical protein